ncbi:lipopolysaccharide transport periplasmic protein LptA [Pseudoxanthomonas taiwanensis]|uniref:Lipopolysaccharide export system protein LptA n=1 Tax=Pseudoxanthomonas taiwanensis TaxID=176598 RepID=A0A921NV59_9GAMM|nr:lipopolysaccharide transport periplasmic protein LptA [Pseudoxanthomonas taiwanensis]KAF1690343.1 lipopolysaccharide transport periplasmic protein LptA [Pseudoxanthomonas taiwanensis]
MNLPRAASSRTGRAILLLALVPALATGALARTSDRNQPMTVDADTSDCNLTDAAGTCTFIGNVVIVQGTLEINADRAQVQRRDGNIGQIVLTGRQARMRQQMDDGSTMSARADRIVYEPDKEQLTLTGNYHVESPRGSNSGQKMVYNMASGQMQSGGDGSRVRTVIQPRAQQDRATDGDE